MSARDIMLDYIRKAREGQTYEERVKDPYRGAAKPKEPAVCPKCRAVFHKGRWSHDKAPKGAHESLCPACMRERDEAPAGIITLSGDFFAARREEILNLIRNAEERARGEHPLERIMAVEQRGEETVVTFTDAHLAHGVGEALRHAYHGELDSRYTDKDGVLRISWRR